MKALPYGISDFPRIMRKNYYYVDKSRYIEMIERQPSYLFLIRPRRFGKSLFLAMLETYYSIDYADSFEEIFGELYIGKHPTEEHNKYMVLRFNFSAISSKLEDVERSFFSIIPIFILFVCFQQYFIEGMTAGAVKE